MIRSLVIHIIATCALLSAMGARAQVAYRSVVINASNGETYTFGINQVDSITFSPEPSVQHSKWYHCIENPGVADYLREFEYDPEDYTYHHLFEYRGEPYLDARQDWPYGVTLGDTTYYNLIPNQTYHLAYISEYGTKWIDIQTLGQLRMIRTDGLDNVRDLGGWPTADGQSLRYGQLFRGTELNTCKSYNAETMHSRHTITSSDLKLFRQQLGIRAELDLRSTSEIPAAKESPLGKDIAYANYAISYTNISSVDNQILIVHCLRFIIDNLRNNRPVYIHCVWGADRTGVLCMLLEGLLGVSQSNLDKDFEITSFCGNTRYRNNDNYTRALRQVKKMPGQNLQEQFRNWWLQAGATAAELDEFCEAMK